MLHSRFNFLDSSFYPLLVQLSDPFSPTSKISDNILMVERWQCHDLSIDFMVFNVLVISKVQSDLLDTVIVRVEFMSNFISYTKPTSTKKTNFFERVLISAIFQVSNPGAIFFVQFNLIIQFIRVKQVLKLLSLCFQLIYIQ